MKVGYLRILGKGNKERVVPVGKVAIEWLGNYLKSGRPKLLGKKASYFVFVGRAGKPITRQRFWQLFKAYSISAGIKSEVSPSTTQIYTHLDLQHLRTIHQKYHPRG
jgi:integrase/recombinase XerD